MKKITEKTFLEKLEKRKQSEKEAELIKPFIIGKRLVNGSVLDEDVENIIGILGNNWEFEIFDFGIYARLDDEEILIELDKNNICINLYVM